MNLLLVDDEVISVKAMLDGVNWGRCGIDHVFTAYTAKAAKDIILSEQVDIALLDIEMPEEDGISLLKWIRREETNPISCAFLTCHAKFDYAREAIALRCTDYLLKPLDYASVEELIIRMAVARENENRKQRLEHYVEQWDSERVNTAVENSSPVSETEAIVEETAAYILDHLTTDKLSVKDLAFRVHLNPDYLNRIFKKHKGIAINSFIIDERMRLAMKLMTEGGLSATAAAQEVGYKHYANFVNMFKKFSGKLPSQIAGEEK